VQGSNLVTRRHTPSWVVDDPVIAAHFVAVETLVSGDTALTQEEEVRRAVDAARVVVVDDQRQILKRGHALSLPQSQPPGLRVSAPASVADACSVKATHYLVASGSSQRLRIKPTLLARENVCDDRGLAIRFCLRRSRVSFRVPMPVFAYRYELRRGEVVVSTGHLMREQALEVGERLEIGGVLGIVRAVEPMLGEREFRLVVQLWREGVAS